MLYAIRNESKIRATPNQKANCIGCNGIVNSFCGEIYNWHWKHDKKDNCDDWFEPETEWHLNWKQLFDKENTEVKISDEKKWHIADIYTNSKVVIELQYSSIDKRVIQTREDFYGEKMFWILNSKRMNIEPLNLDAYYVHSPLVFTTYFDTKVFVRPVWIADFWEFEPTEKLKEILEKNDFIYNTILKKYVKVSSYQTLRKWGYEDDIKKEVKREIILFARKIMKENPRLKKFSLWRPQKTWSDSKRNIFIDNSYSRILWIKSFENDRYGIVEEVDKQKFINKYVNAQ